VHVMSGRAAAVEIGPGGGHEGAAAVRKDEHQLELTITMRPAQDGEGPAFEGVMWTDDGDAGREALEVGSVWLCPSTPSIIGNCSVS
jgi:hypothetical protein